MKLRNEIRTLLKQKMNKFVPNTQNKITIEKLKIVTQALKELNNEDPTSINIKSLNKYQVEFAEIIKLIYKLVRVSKVSILRPSVFSPIEILRNGPNMLNSRAPTINKSLASKQSLKMSLFNKVHKKHNHKQFGSQHFQHGFSRNFRKGTFSFDHIFR